MGRLRRMLRRALFVKVAVVGILLLAGAVLYLRLSTGPLSVQGLSTRVADALAERIGPGWRVSLRDSALELDDGSLALRTTGLEIRDPAGALVMRAPDAVVSVDTLSLVRASLQPRAIEFRDLQLRATVNPDGSLSFAPADEGPPGPAPTAPAASAPQIPDAGTAPEPGPGRSSVSVAVSSLFDLILEPRSIVGALDRARVVNARLTLVDSRGRERAVFRLAEATFARPTADSRSFDMHLEGPKGDWTLSGVVRAPERHRRDGEIAIKQVPVEDILLLSGLSSLPGRTDLKLSGRAEASLIRGHVAKLDARLDAGGGMFQADDVSPSAIPVDIAAAEASWDEARRVMRLSNLAFKGGANDVKLAGEFQAGSPDGAWRLSLEGRDATLSGADEGDRPFRVDAIQLVAAGKEEGAAIERVSLKGPTLSVELEGSVRTSADGGGLAVRARAAGTPVRSVLRLWPETVTPNVRTYLTSNLRAGMLREMTLRVGLSATELADANNGRPIPDGSVRADFAIDGAELRVAEGLPPLTRTGVSGTVTGTRATVQAPRGETRMGDGRVLNLSEGAFVLPDIWADDAVARVTFRMEGGADALGSFLQTPLIRRVSNLDLDPASLKGRTDLRVAIPLAVNNMPKFEDLPITVTGAVSDLSIDKAFGKERFEQGTLQVSYDKGSLAILGEGKLAGGPAAVDIRQPRSAPGELVVNLALDEAARARKGLSFGPQLTGTIPVKVTLPLAKNRVGPRIDLDLSKAGVEGLVPGWTKPAGRPGRLSFTLVDDKTMELRDLTLEAGPVLARGQITLNPEGALEKADLSAFKMSPGDDMRITVERAGASLKVAVRGNVADARPFMRGMGGEGKPQRRAQSAQESRDVDLDVAINILTGHNDEALTGATVRASLRKDELRQLQIGGRLRTAQINGRMISQGGSPVLLLQAQDAGGLLRFLDIYRRMVGGELTLQAALGEGGQAGFLSIDRFALRNEPALRRIIPAQSIQPPSDERSGGAPVARINVNEVQFTRAKLEFIRTASRLDFRDAAIYGSQIGFTLNGWVDYARDRADIAGTFVPAYGLNNAFAQVPIFGPLLGGGSNEGLFAVNFRVSGQATAPTLTVNPLSAIAPGFLRKLFGAGGPDPTGTASMPPPPMQ